MSFCCRAEALPSVNQVTPLFLEQVTNLRTSLSHLTAHLNTLSNRLAASESTLSSLRLSQRKELVRLEEERDGLRALCGVWEGRWREERRGNEDLGALGRTGELVAMRWSRTELISTGRRWEGAERPHDAT